MESSTLNIAKSLLTVDNPLGFLQMLKLAELHEIIDFFAEYIPEAVKIGKSYENLSKSELCNKLFHIIERIHSRVEEIEHQATSNPVSTNFAFDSELKPDGFSIGFAAQIEDKATIEDLPADRQSHLPFTKFFSSLGAEANALGKDKIIRVIKGLFASNEIITLSDGSEVGSREVIGYYRSGEHSIGETQRNGYRVSAFSRSSGNKTFFIAPDARNAILQKAGLTLFLPDTKNNWLTATKIAEQITQGTNNRLLVKLIPRICDIFEQLLNNSSREIRIEVECKPKTFKVKDLVSPYRTNGVTTFCSPLLLPFLEKTLDLAPSLPKDGSWLAGANICKKLQISTTKDNVFKVNAFLKALVQEGKGEGLVGRYNSGGNTRFFIREWAIGSLIKKDDIAKSKSLFKGKNRDDYLNDFHLCLKVFSQKDWLSVYATRRLLEEIYHGRTVVEGINPKEDMHMIKSEDRPHTKVDLYFLRKDSAHFITRSMISEMTKDIKLWELELLELAGKSRTDPKQHIAA